jgi:hypothetical protein
MLMDEVDKGCPDKECSDSKEMQGLPVGAFVEGELHLSRMQMFPISLMPFILYSLLFFSFKNPVRGHYPGVVAMLPTSTFTEMRRLARDETPFLLAMPPRTTTMAW